MDAIVPSDGGPALALIREAVSDAQQNLLTQRTPASVIKERPGKGGKKFRYVPHGWVTEQLNLAFKWGWSLEIASYQILPSDADPAEVIVQARLTVHTPAGDIVKTQFGAKDVIREKETGRPLSVGDDLKAATSDALKKCASLLGIGLDLYYSDDKPAVPSQDEVRFDVLGRQMYGPDWEKTKGKAIMAKVQQDGLSGAADLTPADYRELIARLEKKQAELKAA